MVGWEVENRVYGVPKKRLLRHHKRDWLRIGYELAKSWRTCLTSKKRLFGHTIADTIRGRELLERHRGAIWKPCKINSSTAMAQIMQKNAKN